MDDSGPLFQTLLALAADNPQLQQDLVLAHGRAICAVRGVDFRRPSYRSLYLLGDEVADLLEANSALSEQERERLRDWAALLMAGLARCLYEIRFGQPVGAERARSRLRLILDRGGPWGEQGDREPEALLALLTDLL